MSPNEIKQIFINKIYSTISIRQWVFVEEIDLEINKIDGFPPNQPMITYFDSLVDIFDWWNIIYVYM